MKTYNYLLLGLGLLMGACSNSHDDDGGSNERKDIVLTAGETEIVAKQHGTAFEMLRYFNENSDKDNFMVSPLSLQFALGMLANGAQGNTLDEITAALKISSLDELNSLNKRLLEELPKVDKKTTLHSANSVWLDESFNVLPSYSRAVADYYRAESASVKLSSEEAMKKINSWCSKHTNGMLPQVLKEPFSENVVFALINALYFKGEWAEPFKESSTQKKKFNNTDGSNSTVDMMRKKEYIKFMDMTDYMLGKLEYGNGAYAMTIILPAEGVTLDRAVGSIDAELWQQWKSSSYAHDCDIELPKFKISTDFDLTDYLLSLGIKDAFDKDRADFLAMSDIATFVSLAKQMTEIAVDEKGTEAAAVTIIGGDTMAMPSAPITFHADRPFAFIIEESSTGAILFTGRVNKL